MGLRAPARIAVGVILAVTLASCASSGRTGSPPGSAPTTPPAGSTVPAPTTPPAGSTVPAPTTTPSTTAGPTTPATTIPAPSTTTTPTTSPPVTTAPTTAPTTPPPAFTPTLGPGDRGPAVLQLQQRLSSLGYWLGTPDGNFGDSTEQAVYALQKAAGVSRDGVVGPVTASALARGVQPLPRSTAGYLIEIDLHNQLLMFVRNGTLLYTLNTSTGGGYTYTSQGVTSVAVTPSGHFSIYRQVNGLDISPLGELWRPKYFYSGYAIHGYDEVPPVPVSHGCVRVSDQAIDWIWATGLAPVGTAVWIY